MVVYTLEFGISKYLSLEIVLRAQKCKPLLIMHSSYITNTALARLNSRATGKSLQSRHPETGDVHIVFRLN